MRATAFGVITILSAGVFCACSSFRPHVRTPSAPRGGVFEPRRPGDATSGGGDIGGQVPRVGVAGSMAGRAVEGSQRVCRNASRPSGWIAVAYVSASADECAMRARSDSSAAVAIITFYADRPLGTVLDVCADEPLPRGWTIDEADGEGGDGCPGVERKGSSTFRMRRVR
jgi:hypothetical protein